MRRQKIAEKEKIMEENRAKIKMVDPGDISSGQSTTTGKRILQVDRGGNDQNSISRLAGRHLKTNLTKNVERDGSTAMQRIRSQDPFDATAGGSASRISAGNVISAGASQTSGGGGGLLVNVGGLGPIIEAPDINSPSSPQAGKYV